MKGIRAPTIRGVNPAFRLLGAESMKQRLAMAGLLLAGCLFSAGNVRAQTPENRVSIEELRNQSHVPIDFEGMDFNQALRQRFELLHQKADDKQQEAGDKDQWMKDLMAAAPKLLKNDPEGMKLAKKLVENPNFREYLQQLKTQAKSIPPELTTQVKSIPPGQF